MYVDGQLMWQCIWGTMVFGTIISDIAYASKKPFRYYDTLSGVEILGRVMEAIIGSIWNVLVLYNFIMSLRP